jgi:hypothetical protein
MHSHFSEADIAVLESFRDFSGINSVSRDALSLVGNMDTGLKFGHDPSIWGPSDYCASICSALSILTQEKENASILWSLIFRGVEDGMSSFREPSSEYAIADVVRKVLEYHLSTKRSV